MQESETTNSKKLLRATNAAAITQRHEQTHLTPAAGPRPFFLPPAFSALTLFIFEIQHSRHQRAQQTNRSKGVMMNHHVIFRFQLGLTNQAQLSSMSKTFALELKQQGKTCHIVTTGLLVKRLHTIHALIS